MYKSFNKYGSQFLFTVGRVIVEVEEVKKTRKEVQEDLEMQMW